MCYALKNILYSPSGFIPTDERLLSTTASHDNMFTKIVKLF